MIDVEPSDQFGEPRLLVSDGRRGDYVALTHVWGGTVPLRTMKENLGQHRQQIPMASMPPSFRDAVLTTRRLGLRYLWIDAVCIVQNDPKDWEIEASRMANIYKDSVFTIAAVDAANSTVGFLNKRSTDFSTCRVPCPESASCTGSYIEATLREPAKLLDQTSPLSTRGWCMQEKLLTPAVLFFGSKQTYWSCNSSIHLEAYGAAPPRNALYGGLDFGKSGYMDMVEGLKARRNTCDRTWYRVILEYVTRDLGRLSDKLPALSGLAHEYHAITGFEYLAGLWKQDLDQGLMWVVEEFKDDIHNNGWPISYIAPSWSWASNHGLISFHSDLTDMAMQVVKAETTLAGIDPFGQVTAGALHVFGKIKRFQVRYQENSRLADITYHNHCQSLYSTVTGREVGRCSLDERSYIVPAPTQGKCAVPSREVVCLAMEQRVIASGQGRYKIMVLQRIDFNESDQYRRIGMGILQGSEPDGLKSEDLFGDCAEQTIVIV